MGEMKHFLWILVILITIVNSKSIEFQKEGLADKIQIDPFFSNSLRVRISPNGKIVEPAVQALLPSTPVEDKVFGLSVVNGNIKADISTDGLLTFTRVSDGSVLLQEISHSFAPNEDNLFSAKIRFAAHKELVYGLGEHRTGRLQNKPIFIDFQKSQVYSYSSGSDISIPFYLSNIGYAFLWNLPSFGYLDLNDQYTEWVSNSTQQLDFWITTTKSPSTNPYADLLSQYVDATGHPPVLPYFASGFWQCKDRYRNQSQVLDIAQGYYDRLLPVSIFVIDWQHWNHLGDWSFNPSCWPDPASMVRYLNELGTEVMVSVWPLIEEASNNFATMKNLSFFVHDSKGNQPGFHAGQYIYDPFNPKARDYVWQQIKKGYYDKGIKTYWLDASEPERFLPDQSGQYYYFLGRDLQVGMAFPFMHQQTVFNGMKSLGEQDILMLSRSAWAGSQRWSTAVWSGDIVSTFDELAIQVRAAQNMAMSGIYWWTTDIGGYHSGNIQDPVFRELIVRWFQFGAFCPIFRLHGHRQPEDPASQCGGSGGLNEVWQFGDTAYNAISKIIFLREELRDYVMVQMKLASANGTPVLRPIFFDFPDVPNSYLVDDQFMFGPNWVVAPVLKYQASYRSVYLPPLPEHQVWCHYFSDQIYAGGHYYNISTPIDSFPLFYKKYLPLVPVVQLYSAERNDHVLCLSPECFAANCQTCDGKYVTVRTEGYSLTLDGISGTIPLKLWYSSKYSDNFVSTSPQPPDSSYSINLENGYIWKDSLVVGMSPLDLYFNEATGHHVTVASLEGHRWAVLNGFQLVSHLGYIWALS